jgi:hypothetical protein
LGIAILAGAVIIFAGAGSVLAQVSNAEMQRLHNALGLSNAQEGSWQTFERAYKIPPEEQQQRRSAADLSHLSAPERMDSSIAQAQQYLDAIKQRGMALKVFYLTLSPQQRATFDRETVPPGP